MLWELRVSLKVKNRFPTGETVLVKLNIAYEKESYSAFPSLPRTYLILWM